jgi:WD40 repeat protein
MRVLKGHKEPVTTLAFSADGRTLLSVSQQKAQLWDVTTGQPRWSMNSICIYWAAFTPEGQRLLTEDFSMKRRSCWDVATGASLPSPVPKKGSLRIPHFSPDGTLCVALSRSNQSNALWWEYPSWQALPPWKMRRQWHIAPRDVAFHPGGRILAVLLWDRLCLYDAPGGEVLLERPFTIKQAQGQVAFDPRGRLLAVSSGPRSAILDVTTGEWVTEVKQAKKYILQAAFTPDGRYLATVSNEATVKFWDTSSWRLAQEFAWQVGGLRCLAFSPDGMLAAAAGAGRTVVVWDVDW